MNLLFRHLRAERNRAAADFMIVREACMTESTKKLTLPADDREPTDWRRLDYALKVFRGAQETWTMAMDSRLEVLEEVELLGCTAMDFKFDQWERIEPESLGRHLDALHLKWRHLSVRHLERHHDEPSATPIIQHYVLCGATEHSMRRMYCDLAGAPSDLHGHPLCWFLMVGLDERARDVTSGAFVRHVLEAWDQGQALAASTSSVSESAVAKAMRRG